MKVKISVTSLTFHFLKTYHTNQHLLKAQTEDEIGVVAFGILCKSWNDAKWADIPSKEFLKAYKLSHEIQLEIPLKKFKLAKRHLIGENQTVIAVPTLINKCKFDLNWCKPRKSRKRSKAPANRTSYKFNNEAVVSFDTYVRALINSTFLSFMNIQVNIKKQKIKDSIEEFQQIYDLSDVLYSAETCKRYWQRHKNDVFAPKRLPDFRGL